MHIGYWKCCKLLSFIVLLFNVFKYVKGPESHKETIAFRDDHSRIYGQKYSILHQIRYSIPLRPFKSTNFRLAMPKAWIWEVSSLSCSLKNDSISPIVAEELAKISAWRLMYSGLETPNALSDNSTIFRVLHSHKNTWTSNFDLLEMATKSRRKFPASSTAIEWLLVYERSVIPSFNISQLNIDFMNLALLGASRGQLGRVLRDLNSLFVCPKVNHINFNDSRWVQIRRAVTHNLCDNLS